MDTRCGPHKDPVCHNITDVDELPVNLNPVQQRLSHLEFQLIHDLVYCRFCLYLMCRTDMRF